MFNTGDTVIQPAYLVFDMETIPDGKLIQMVKYSQENISPEEAIARAQKEARERSPSNSDFLPVSYHLPVAVCVMRVGKDYRIQAVTSLDAPQFRTREIARDFWRGLSLYNKANLVTFNGRGFDLPVMELMAFRYGLGNSDYFRRSRTRYNGQHIDLLDFFTNFGACRLVGGLNLFSKILGKPGKMELAGDQVYQFYQAGKIREINDYCLFDTLDTYFVFLRSRVIIGELALEQEQDLVAQGKQWLLEKAESQPALHQYLQYWGSWEPWP